VVLVAAGLLAAGVAGVWTVGFTGVFGVRTVVVHGESAVSARTVLAAAAVPTGTPLARLDVGGICARIGAIPGIQHARVSRSWPSTVRIDVLERRPLAVLPRGAALWLVDIDGVLFQQVRSAPAGLPRLVVAGPDPGSTASRAALTVLAALPARVRRVVQVVEAPSPGSVTLDLRDGRTVIWGGVEQSATKARVLLALLSRPGSTYDVSTPTVAVVR
jgi:cell division protein FtsQ